ncbi:MAG: RdgB/HAM1 family non-canonical purine NTP pyrophosphatase [Candidatus Izemoplasmatales bacterium]
MTDILIATNNKNKLNEFKSMASMMNLNLKSLDDFPPYPETLEKGLSFKENAYLKALDAYLHTLTPSLADDSGLEVRALSNAPGVYSKRYSSLGTDSDNNSFLLANLENVVQRDARFVCVLCFIKDLDHIYYFEGEVLGTILREPIGNQGFGYDPIFFVNEAGCSMAEISTEDKNRYSHRGRAFRSFLDKVGDLL